MQDVPDLLGLVVLDHNIIDYSPIDRLSQLRSLSLGCGAKKRQNSVPLAALPSYERLYLAEKLTNEDGVFECKGLRRLALTKFPQSHMNFSAYLWAHRR